MGLQHNVTQGESWTTSHEVPRIDWNTLHKGNSINDASRPAVTHADQKLAHGSR